MTKDEQIDEVIDEKPVKDLAQLLKGGVNTKVPVTFKYPELGVEVGAMIRPLSSVEWNEAVMKELKLKRNNLALSICKKALYDTDGKKIPAELIDKMAAGVVLELYDKISEISGVTLDAKKEEKLINHMMGF